MDAGASGPVLLVDAVVVDVFSEKEFESGKRTKIGSGGVGGGFSGGSFGSITSFVSIAESAGGGSLHFTAPSVANFITEHTDDDDMMRPAMLVSTFGVVVQL